VEFGIAVVKKLVVGDAARSFDGEEKFSGVLAAQFSTVRGVGQPYKVEFTSTESK
jgi:hypothetical protein